MRGRRRSTVTVRAGFSLLELLMVIAVIAILTASLMPMAESTQHDTLLAAAQCVATDMAYARSLAVANNSSYKVEFNTARNKYVLEHSGTNTDLDTLPSSVFRDPDDPADRHIVKLDELPGIGGPVKLAGAFLADNPVRVTDEIEFGPLGETTEPLHAVLLLTLRSGAVRRHALVVVNPVTGLATVHPYSEDLPSDFSSATAEEIVDKL